MHTTIPFTVISACALIFTRVYGISKLSGDSYNSALVIKLTRYQLLFLPLFSLRVLDLLNWLIHDTITYLHASSINASF